MTAENAAHSIKSEYLLDNAWRQARERLRLLEVVFDAGTTRLLAMLGVGPGWNCLEVGGGGGSTAEWLCDHVAPDGRVLATDINTRFLDALNLPGLKVRRHDILVDDLPEAVFDLVHARAVLEHLPERVRALQRMAAALRPGGWLLVEDTDFASFVPGAGVEAADADLFRKCWAVSRQVGEARGSAAEYGRYLYGAVRDLGLEDLGGEGRVAVSQGGSPIARFWRLTTEQMHEAIVGSGGLSEEELKRYYALLENPACSWLMPTMVAAWGRRPSR